MLIPDALAAVLTTGTAATAVTVPWLIRARRRAAQAEAAHASKDQRLRSVLAEARHLAKIRLPGLVVHLATPHVPIPPLAEERIRGSELDELHREVMDLLANAVHDERIRVDTAAQAVIREAAQSARTTSIRMQELLIAMQEAFDDPKVLEYVLALDRLNEFARRRPQAAGIVCDDTPGLTRLDTHLADLVTSAQSRIEGFEQIETVNYLDADSRIGIVAPAAEPIAIILAELLANAVFHSASTIRVHVEIHSTASGASVIIDDPGVGLSKEDLDFANQMLSGRRVLLTELGQPVRMGFAAIGRLIRNYPSVRVTLGVSPHGGVRAVVHISSDLFVTMDPVAQPVSVMAPIPVSHRRGDELTPEAAGGYQTAPHAPAGPSALPQRRRQQPVRHAAGPAAQSNAAPPDAEKIRSRYSGLQNGINQGRSDAGRSEGAI